MISKKSHQEFIKHMFPSTAAMISLRLTDFCSHRCPYCIDGDCRTNPNRSDLIDKMGIDKFIDHLLLLGREEPLEYRLSGGEPTESPYFLDVVDAIIKDGKHSLRIMTNGQSDKLVRAFDKYDKKDMNLFLEASFHLGAFLLDKDDKRIDKWNQNMNAIIPKCRKVVLVVPLSMLVLQNASKLIASLSSVKDACVANGVEFGTLLTELYGRDIDGRNMPQEYDEEEIKVIEGLHGRFSQKDAYKSSDEFDVFENRAVERLQLGTSMELQGVDCYYSKMFYLIQTSSGYIIPCGSGNPAHAIGNIGDYNSVFMLANQIEDNDKAYDACPFATCNCILKGELACLTPNRIKIKTLLENTDAQV